MRRVMLLRHAKSDWSQAAGGDLERPLNARGKEAAPEIGRYIAQAGIVPDYVLCSTARRARQTCELAIAAFAKIPRVTFQEKLYLAEPDTIIDLVRTTPDKVRSVMMIGHNPGIHQAACDLTGSGVAADRNMLAARFPTAALAVIDFEIDDWTQVRSRTGKLDLFITPRLLPRKDQA